MSLILLLSSAWESSKAQQQAVFPDSIVIIRDTQSGRIGFVFPESLAVDYRNLIVNYVPALEGKISLQDSLIAEGKKLLKDKNAEIVILNANMKDTSQMFEEQKGISESFEKLYKQERRAKRFWRVMAYLLGAGAVAVLVVK